MTVRYSEWTQCANKRRYSSRRRAELAAKAMARREKDVYDVYFCAWCGLFHCGGVVLRPSEVWE